MHFHEDVVMPEVEFPIKYYSFSSLNDDSLAVIMHWHKELELVYIIEGTLTSQIGDEKYYAGKGETILVNPNEPHSYTVEKGPFSLFVILLDLSLLPGRLLNADDFMYLTPLMSQKVKIANFLPADEALKHCIDGLILENSEKKPGYCYAVKSYVYGLIVRLFRQYTPELPKESTAKVISRTLAQVNQAIQFIETKYAQEINLDDLAEMLNISKPHLCRIFKRATGQTFVHYLNQLRVNHSLKLLENRNKTVTDIAFEVGFSDSNYFSRVFHDLMKQTPTGFRNGL